MHRVFLLLTFFSFALSSCAVISTSQFETAKTLKEREGLIGAGFGMGRDVSTGIYFNSDAQNFPSPIIEIFGRTSIDKHVDAGLKWWIATGIIGIKGSGKFQLTPDDAKMHVAFAPGISWTGSDIEEIDGDHTAYASATSFHVSMLWSAHPSKTLSVYGGFHYVYSHIATKKWNDERRAFDLHSPGLTFGIELNVGPVSLMPEFSVYRAYDFILGSPLFVVFPNGGLAVRF